MSNLTPHPTWDILDATKINCFMTCPRKFFYQYVLGWKNEVPNIHLHFGTCWHIAMEYLLLHGYSDESLSAANELLLTEYRSVFGPESDEMYAPKTPQNAAIVLAKYCAEYPNDMEDYEVVMGDNGNPYTEIAGTVTIGENRFIYFRMDSVLRRKSDGKVKSREHKTGSSPYLWLDQWPLAFQVGCYNHVLNCLFDYDEVLGVEMNGCLFKKSKKGWAQLAALETLTVNPPYEFIRGTIHKSKPQMQCWMDNANAYFGEIETEFHYLEDANEGDDTLEAFPLRTVNCIGYGKICEFNDFCLTWANPLQKCYKAPIGFEVDFWNPMAQESKQTFTF